MEYRPRYIPPTDAPPKTETCRFQFAYSVNRCGQPADASRICEGHQQVKCVSCKGQATNECSYCGQFVCGAPLCDDCQGTEDRGKDPGSWGFLNHRHVRKSERAA